MSGQNSAPGGRGSGQNGGGNPGQGGGGGNPGQGGGNPGPGGRKDAAHIIVDNVPKTVRQGDWIVSVLKQEVGVDAAKVLAEITPTGLIDLDDNAHIDVKDGMRFMSHARKGGAS
jgi:hypothetical protein